MSEKRGAWLDTNVILRYLIHDHEEMFQAASRVFHKAEQGGLILYLHPLIIAELVWTLDSYYGYQREEITITLLELIGADGIIVPERALVCKALLDYRRLNVDYIDAYLAACASQVGPTTVITFDRKHFTRLHAETILLP